MLPPLTSVTPANVYSKVEEYEVLVGQGSAVLWVDSRELGRPGAPHPIEGGHEDTGAPLYIAQAEYGGGYQLGKSGGEFEGQYRVWKRGRGC